MARKELTVEPRQVSGKKVAQLRRAGVLPANIYGHGIESVSVQLLGEDLEQTLKAATANEVIDLKVAGEPATRSVVIHKVQRHPLNSSILHADFYQVSLREKMRGEVPIVLIGSSEAVSTFNGVLMSGVETIHVEALPLDMPTRIEVDIAIMTQLEDSIHVRDLNLPENVTVLNEPDVVIAKVASPRVSVEGASAAETAAEAAEEGQAAAPEA